MENRIDVSAQTMRVTKERLDVVDFSYPLWQYKELLAYRRPSVGAPRNLLLAPFQLEMWLVLLGAIILVRYFDVLRRENTCRSFSHTHL